MKGNLMDNSFTAADLAQMSANAAMRETERLVARVRELEMLVATMCQHMILKGLYPEKDSADDLPPPLRAWFNANHKRLGVEDPLAGHTVRA